MPIILIIDKTGTCKELNVKKYAEEELYKKAGFKSGEGFTCATCWDVEVAGKKYSISLYGKTTGKANQENKYEFPPPVDNTLFFGSCILVNNAEEETVGSITTNEWEVIYENLFGGFEDVGEEDSEVSEEEIDETLPTTKNGYVKDGFVVDDDADEDDETEEESDFEDEEEEIVPKPKRKSPVKKEVSEKKVKTVFEKINTDVIPTTFMDCTSELEEEEYL